MKRYLKLGPTRGGGKPVSPPSEMIAFFERYIIGQEEAKRQLASVTYRHYTLLNQAEVSPLHQKPGKILLLGPTGTGKTYMVNLLAEYLGVPISTGSAAQLVESGYIGSHVTDLLVNLIHQSGEDIENAQRGIIFIDEFDKVALGKRSADYANAIQNELLQMLDGGTVMIPERRRDFDEEFPCQFDCSGILFVLAGAFEGLQQIVDKRLSIGGMGFGKEIKQEEDNLPPVLPEDLIKYGLGAELVGRISSFAQFEKLDVSALTKILAEANGSPLTAYRTFFYLHGIDLTLSKEALVELAAMALKRKVGARALRTVLDNLLSEYVCRIDEFIEKKIVEIHFTDSAVKGEADPEYIGGSRYCSFLTKKVNPERVREIVSSMTEMFG